MNTSHPSILFNTDFLKNRVPEYSIVIPIHNEHDSLKPLLAEILQTMAPLSRCYEIVFVDDGSSDKSYQVLDEFVTNLLGIVRILRLTERSGQTAALKKGLQSARADIVITMDGDLQNDPADIPKMLAKMKEGFQCVCGWRKSRQDTLLKALLSKLGNILQRMFTKLTIHDLSCTLRVYTKGCARQIPLEWEGQHRFIPLCLAFQGCRVGEVESNHRKRQFGKSKYNHIRIIQVIRDFFKVMKGQKKKGNPKKY
jgi:glycosyltransferase involved in cell wall biosynthesis